ncbi:hypothetical protein K492DRAFT_211813 [Lichtheimia hyalospora FSU 10163]|nr:hypothetical protein K492DRAFT_211813 [Lichtheimia hyalospora FSU 10163]
MTESKWDKLCHHRNIRVEYGDHASIITESTCAIQQTIQQLLQQLNNRAMSLTACVQYDLALEDAAMMREIAPWSSLGYLRACDVYASQCRQWAVVDMCTQGLVAVAKEDPGYHKLEAHQTEAKDTSSKRVDFISKLPFDVVICNIIPRIMKIIMPFDSMVPSPLFYVSRTWHERILQTPDGLAFHASSTDIDNSTLGHDQLLRFAPYVTRLDVLGKALALRYFEPHLPGSFLSNIFARADFKRLTTLNLKVDIYSEMIVPARLRDALAILGSTLKHLSIVKTESHSLQDGYPIILNDVIRCCSNLVSLTIENIRIMTTAILIHKQYKLRHFKFFQGTSFPTKEQVIDMLSLFPSLTSLALNLSLGPTTLAEIHKCCPLLEQLTYWDSHLPYTNMIHSKCNSICVANERTILNMESVASYMVQRAASLEAFEFQGEFRSDQDTFPILASTFFPKLRNISFTHVGYSCIPFILWVIQHANAIQSITLDNIVDYPSVVDAILQLNNVHTLNLTTYDAGSLLPLIKHHVHLGIQSTLRKVHISTTNTMCNALWFRAIARLQNLEYFELCIPKRILNTFASFFEAMAEGCHSLKWLKLVANEAPDGSSMPTIETDVLEALGSFRNLDRLTLHASTIYDDSLLVLRKISNLRCLNLRLNRSLQLITKRRLQSAIPNVIIEPWHT